MHAQHHRVCSLGEGIAFFVVSGQKDGDSADNSAASSYGLMRSGPSPGLISRALSLLRIGRVCLPLYLFTCIL